MASRLPSTIRAALREVRGVVREPPLFLWSLFVLAFPFYVGPPGLPQPADWLLLILLPILLARWNGQLPGVTRTFRALLVFVVYCVAINMLWTVVLGAYSINLKQGFLLSPTFYIFNALMLFAFLLTHQRYGTRFLWVLSRVAFMSVFLQVILSFFARDYALRSSLMFNNPNQLGYFGLLVACILLLAHQRLRLSTLYTALGLAACCYLALMSASQAALGSIVLLGIALMLSRLRTMMMATLVLVVLAFTSNPFSRALEKAQTRIENDQSHGLLEERGYDRVIQHPEYWLFGSGEGDYQRFRDTTVIGSHELHSSAATLFFCYGIVGVSLFGAFIWMALRRAGPRMLLVVLPSFAYGMFHQGLRFTMMWVLLGLVIALGNERQAEQLKARLPQE